MKNKSLFIGIAFCCIALAIAACAGKNKSESREVLDFGVMSSMDYLPLAVAKHQGYFDKEGVEVNLQKFFSANERDAAIQSNNLDGSILDYTGAAIQRAGGIDLYLTSQCDGTFELVARKSLNLLSDSDFKGKKFAVARNTVVDFCTDVFLQSKKIDLKDIHKSEINKIPLRLEMLRSEQIDLTVLPDPFATIARSEGNPVVVGMKELDCNVTGIVFAASAIAEKRAAIDAFYRAYNLAIDDLKTKPLPEFYEILTTEIGFPKEVVDKVKLPEYSYARLPENKDLDRVSTWLKEKNIISQSFDIQTLVNTEFAPEN